MKSIIRLFAGAVQRRPLLLLVAVVALTIAFGYLAGQMQLAQGNEGFAPDNEEIRAQERISELFADGATESVVQVVVRSPGGDGLTADGAQAVAAAVEAITTSEAAPRLSEAEGRPPIVSYLAPVLQAAQQQGLDLAALTDAEVKQLYQQALAEMPPEQAGFVTSLLGAGANPTVPQADAGLMLVFLTPPDVPDGEAFDAQLELDQAVADAVRSVALPEGLELRPFSFALLFESQDDFQQEVGRLFGMAFVIILAILAFVYWMRPRGNVTLLRSLRRTAADVGLTLVTIVLAITWMQGIGVLLERAGIITSFNEITQIVPILLIGLGVDYGIHLTARYREEVGEGMSVDGGVGRAISTVGVALILATVTTAVGFLTNVVNPLPALSDFGILAAVGIVVSFVLMLSFVPAVRLLLDRRAERAGRLPTDGFASSSERLLPSLMERASVLAERAAVPTLVVTLLLGAGGYWALTQLETRFSVTDFLPEDAPAVETLQIIEEEFGGGFGESTQVLVEAGEVPLTRFHNALVEASRNLVETPDVRTFDLPSGQVASADSPIAIIGSLIRPGPSGQPLAPQVAELAAQLGVAADLSVPDGVDIAPLWESVAAAVPEQWSQVVAGDGTSVEAVLFDVDTQAGEDRAGALASNLREAFLPVTEVGGEAIPTSQNIISAVIVEELSASQVSSLLITVLAAMVVLVINFWFENRRLFLGVITTIPVGLVVLWTFGLMWLTGIPFGPVTATLAALAVGIGIPYTIHIARRFEEDRIRFSSLEEALRSTTRHTGGALAGSAFTTAAGFGILVTSSLKPFQQMGQVTAYAIVLSLAAAVLVLPSLLALWERYHRRRGHEAVEKETAPVV